MAAAALFQAEARPVIPGAAGGPAGPRASPRCPRKPWPPGASVDVLIAGAGPVGLTLANEPTRHGDPGVRLPDRKAAIVETSEAAKPR